MVRAAAGWRVGGLEGRLAAFRIAHVSSRTVVTPTDCGNDNNLPEIQCELPMKASALETSEFLVNYREFAGKAGPLGCVG